MNIQTINGIAGYTFKEKAEHVAAFIPFASARGGFQVAISQNALGLATILYWYKNNKPDRFAELSQIWYNWGGDENNFNAYINSGNNKNVRQIAPAILNRFPIIKNLVNMATKINNGGSIGYCTPQLGGMQPGGIGVITEATASVVASVVKGIGIISSMVIVFKKDKNTNPDNYTDPLPTDNTGTTDPNKPKDAFSSPYLLIGLALVGAYLMFGTKGKSNPIN